MNPPIIHAWDPLFQQAAKRFFNDELPWQLFKAQSWQESRFNANATSEAGAVGPMQFEPETWDIDVLESATLDFPKEAVRSDPLFAIPAGVWYDRRMWDNWSNPKRVRIDRIRLMLASYNAGFGNMLHAQHRAQGALEAGPILAELSHVTGADNAQQTRDYVRLIEGYTRALGAQL